MKKTGLLWSVLLCSLTLAGQQIDFEEYDLDNGLHVIIHPDHSAPVLTTAVMYHVGGKDEEPDKTGFAHFFEHLLFEGTKNIERGQWDKIVSANGGNNNANTTMDRTYYYENFPSNCLDVSLWMESERMLHPVINQKGVDVQKEVVQEEKRLRVDNSPYGRVFEQVSKHMFKKHPYRWTTIGSLDHLASATLDDFKKFNEIYYVPNNAVLVVAGDVEVTEAKKSIEKYFGSIPKGAPIKREKFVEEPITETIKATFHDPNVQVPLLLQAYRTPPQKDREAYVLDMISTYLSSGNSSKLYKRLVDEKQMALQVYAFNLSQEDYGVYLLGGLPVGQTPLNDIQVEIDDEIKKLQTDLITDKDHQKLLNIFENNFISSNSSVAGIANSLARFHMFYGDTNLINKQLDIYRSITKEEIRQVAQKYLNPNQRLELEYLPEAQQTN